MFFNDRHRAGSFPLRQPKSRNASNYKLLKNQLEQQTSALLHERKHLQNYYPLHSEQNIPSNYHSRKKVSEKGPKSQVSDNIQEIVRLCEEDKSKLRNQFEEMSRAERNIFQLMTEQKGETLQLQNYEVRQPKSSRKHEKAAKSRKNRLERDEVSETFQSIKQKLERGNGFSDDIFMMIEAIQRKALLEIDALKKDKSELAKELSEERNERRKLQAKLDKMDKQNNKKKYKVTGEEERRELQQIMEEYNPQILKDKILQLHEENKKYKNYFFNRQSELRNRGQDSDYLKSQISNLQQKLHEYQIQINQLKHSQSSHVEFDLLLQQGELLRKETLHLLRKQGLLDIEIEKIIKNLQTKLQEEEIAKNAFLRDLEKFKENYLHLEEENRRLRQRMSEEGTENQWKSYHTRSTRNEKNRRSPKRTKERLELYENLIGEIKRVTN